MKTEATIHWFSIPDCFVVKHPFKVERNAFNDGSYLVEVYDASMRLICGFAANNINKTDPCDEQTLLNLAYARYPE